MKKTILLFFIGLAAFSSGKGQDVEAIREVILEAYVNGTYNHGILRNMELGYSPNFQVIGLTDSGRDSVLTLQEWMAMVKRQKAEGRFPLPLEKRASVRYDQINIAGSLANVKLTLLFGNKPAEVNFLDLYKYPTGWMIVNKTFQEYVGEQP